MFAEKGEGGLYTIQILFRLVGKGDNFINGSVSMNPIHCVQKDGKLAQTHSDIIDITAVLLQYLSMY